MSWAQVKKVNNNLSTPINVTLLRNYVQLVGSSFKVSNVSALKALCNDYSIYTDSDVAYQIGMVVLSTYDLCEEVGYRWICRMLGISYGPYSSLTDFGQKNISALQANSEVYEFVMAQEAANTILTASSLELSPVLLQTAEGAKKIASNKGVMKLLFDNLPNNFVFTEDFSDYVQNNVDISTNKVARAGTTAGNFQNHVYKTYEDYVKVAFVKFKYIPPTSYSQIYDRCPPFFVGTPNNYTSQSDAGLLGATGFIVVSQTYNQTINQPLVLVKGGTGYGYSTNYTADNSTFITENLTDKCLLVYYDDGTSAGVGITSGLGYFYTDDIPRNSSTAGVSVYTYNAGTNVVFDSYLVV